jgi:hypothetical protein
VWNTFPNTFSRVNTFFKVNNFLNRFFNLQIFEISWHLNRSGRKALLGSGKQKENNFLSKVEEKSAKFLTYLVYDPQLYSTSLCCRGPVYPRIRQGERKDLSKQIHTRNPVFRYPSKKYNKNYKSGHRLCSTPL